MAGRNGELLTGASGWKALWPWLVLLTAGVGWGFSFSMVKLAAAGGARPLGIAFWQCAVGALLMIAFAIGRGRAISTSRRLLWLYVVCGLLGLVIPSTLFFYAASRISAGVLAISVAIVPILTYAISAAYGLERFVLVRMMGVIFGTVSIALLVGPKQSLPDPSQIFWVVLVFGSAVSYSAMNVTLALRMPEDASAFSVTCGMFAAAALMLLPIALITNSFVALDWPLSQTGWAALALGVNSAICWSLYIYLVNYAGPVFGSQTANVVTLSGVIWGILIFGDRHSLWIWLSLATMMAGLALVTPREKELAAP